MTDLIVASSAINSSDMSKGFTRQQLREILALDFLCSIGAAYEERWAETVLQNKWENRVGWVCSIPVQYADNYAPLNNNIGTEVCFDYSTERYLLGDKVVLPGIDQSNLFLECSFLVCRPGRRERANVAIRFVAGADDLYRVNDFWCNDISLLSEDGPTKGNVEQISKIFGRLARSLHAASREELLNPEPWLLDADSDFADVTPAKSLLDEPPKRRLIGNDSPK